MFCLWFTLVAFLYVLYAVPAFVVIATREPDYKGALAALEEDTELVTHRWTRSVAAHVKG
jgi:hypothetical protein